MLPIRFIMYNFEYFFVFPLNVQLSYLTVFRTMLEWIFSFTIDFQYARMYECVFVYGLVLITLIDNEWI